MDKEDDMRRLHMLRREVPNLVIAQRVLDKMAAAASHFLQDETGEALVGLLVPGTHTNGVPTIYVLDTIAPDESAVREWATFQQGDELQEDRFLWLLENWRLYRAQGQDHSGKKLPAKWDVPLIHVGDWHKQPGFMIQPSQGDLMTARQMVADPENHMEFLLAPIVTLGHPSTTLNLAANSNFITIPQGNDSSMRVDFWYLDDKVHDFLPISPTVYPTEQLPELPEYPWHLIHEDRFNAEYDALQKAGLFTSLLLWNAVDQPPLEICFLTARVGADKVLILITPWNYPAAPPTARIAPFVQMGEGEDLYTVFEEMWTKSEAVPNPPGWTWAEGRYLIDYVYALEEALGLKPAATAAPETADAPSQPTPTPAATPVANEDKEDEP